MSLRRVLLGPKGLWLVAALSLAACAAGVVLAVTLDQAAHGQRGGAVAVALTFAMLFLGRDTAAWALNARFDDAGPRSGGGAGAASGSVPVAALGETDRQADERAAHEEEFAEARDEVGLLAARVARMRIEMTRIDTKVQEYDAYLPGSRNAVAAMIDWQDREKIPLAVASIVGTAFAGFGDLIARAFGAGP